MSKNNKALEQIVEIIITQLLRSLLTPPHSKPQQKQEQTNKDKQEITCIKLRNNTVCKY